MSQLFVDNIKNRTGGAVGFPTGVVVTGVATFNNQVSIAGTLTYEDVTNVDSVGVITARLGIRVGAGQSIGSDGAAVVYYGDGSNLDGVVSGVEIKSGGSSVGTSLTAINFESGATVSTGSAGITTITIAAGITTAYQTPSANALITLNLGTAQYHDTVSYTHLTLPTILLV